MSRTKTGDGGGGRGVVPGDGIYDRSASPSVYFEWTSADASYASFVSYEWCLLDMVTLNL